MLSYSTSSGVYTWSLKMLRPYSYKSSGPRADSDGKIDRFIAAGSGEGAPVLPLHALDGRPYLLAMFLTGAYQEVPGPAQGGTCLSPAMPL